MNIEVVGYTEVDDTSLEVGSSDTQPFDAAGIYSTPTLPLL